MREQVMDTEAQCAGMNRNSYPGVNDWRGAPLLYAPDGVH